jgi:hypothetical protein
MRAPGFYPDYPWADEMAKRIFSVDPNYTPPDSAFFPLFRKKGIILDFGTTKK